MKILLRLSFVGLGFLTACQTAYQPPAFVPPSEFSPAFVAYPRVDAKGNIEAEWMEIFKRECADAQRGELCKVAFLGDSITDFWASSGKSVWDKDFAAYHPLNFGIRGDRTENLLWRLENGLLPPQVQPKLFVMMIGTNNTGHRMEKPEAIAAGIQKIVQLLQTERPKAKILILAIFPRGNDAKDAMRINNDKVNTIIKTFADHEKVFFADIGDKFLEPNGVMNLSLMPDRLHPNTKGYEVWAEAIKPKLEQLADIQ